MKVMGLMSGTSADGVDAAVVDIRGRGHHLAIKLLAFHTYPYPAAFRASLFHAIGNGTVQDLCHMNAALGGWFAQAALGLLRRARLSPEDIALIGSHGQTFYHQPKPRVEGRLGPLRSTLQLGAPAVIAERTGITTVSDFRMRDMAAGGEGAPLTPYVHYLLFRHRSMARAVLNIGGISNVTYLPAGGSLKKVQAFDTGPGNMLIDGLVRHLTRGKRSYDRDGKLAAKGTVREGLMRGLLRHPYVLRRPPKSTGREEFGDGFLTEFLRLARRPGLSNEDLIATATAFTARTIAQAGAFLPGKVDELLVCGGGAKNITLMRMLRASWAGSAVRTVGDRGWDARALEAVAFAVFAYQAARGVACNLPSVTGAKRSVILGSITPGKNRQPKS
jgi:anhydro-N-acetylmuramic acid kinase